MTLIAAFRCSDGVVICADTQETVGAFRVSVDKIAPREVGEYELVIGGAGSLGGLIDDFTENFSRSVESWPAELSEQDIRLKIRRALLEFHRGEVAHYPAAPDDKRLEFIICIKGKAKGAVAPKTFLWRTDGTGLVTVTDYTLLGYDDAIYKHEVKRLYDSQHAMSQAVLLSINLLTMAKATSNYIGGDTQLIIVRDYGMRLAEPNDVRDLEQRSATFNQALAELVLACPDLSIDNDEFRGLLANFESRVMQLREHYLELYVDAMLDRAINDPNYTGDTLPSGLTGTLVTRGQDGTIEILSRDGTLTSVHTTTLHNVAITTRQGATPSLESEPESLPSDSQTSEDQP